MSLKDFCFTGLLFLLPVLSFGQDFAGIGTRWYYNEQFAFSGDVDYIRFTSEKDTVVRGIPCHKIIKRHKITCFNRPDAEFLYSRNDSVFFYEPSLDTFQVLYDFSAEPGDQWEILIRNFQGSIDTFSIQVTNVSTRNINGFDLKELEVLYSQHNEGMTFSYLSEIVERIGDLKYMFFWYYWSLMACDANYTTGLRCYQDTTLGLYSTGLADSCDYTYQETGIKNREEPPVVVYPNPATDYVTIRTERDTNHTVDLLDMDGRILVSRKFQSDITLDLSAFKPAVYFLRILEQDRLIRVHKLIRIHD